MTSLLDQRISMRDFFGLPENERDILRLWVSQFVNVHDCFAIKLVDGGYTWFSLYKRDEHGNRYFDEHKNQLAQYIHLIDTGYPSVQVLGVMNHALFIL